MAGIRFNGGTRVLSFGNARIKLPPQEAGLLAQIIGRKGQLAPTHQLERAIDPECELLDARKQVNVRVHWIRRRLRESAIPITITTHWGGGYSVESEVEIITEDLLVLGPHDISTVRRLIAKCSDAALAERASYEILGE